VQHHGGNEGKTMKMKQKLQNPFALVVQGFVAGAIIFYATAPNEPRNAGIDESSQISQAVEKLEV